MAEEPMRLQRFLARAGVASRRASEQLILDGRVSVDGQVVTELGTKVVPGVSRVSVDGGAPLSLDGGHVVLMLNKPAGVLTTMDDQFGRSTVASLVPVGEYPGLFPVGRLDGDTTGLLLFTNDGDLGHALLHPRRHVDKTYEAVVAGGVGKKALKALSDGVVLEDGPTLPGEAHLDRSWKDARTSKVVLTIHEGRKRQVKRMLSAVGHPVRQLHRSAFGPLSLGSLPQGSWRLLDEGEVAALKAACGMREGQGA